MQVSIATARRLRFHDLRHTFASHLIIDIRLDVVQVSRILGHARTSMTLDTYTHLFEESTFEPRLPAGERLRATRAATPRRLPGSSGQLRRCCPRVPAGRRCYVTKT